MKIKLTILFIAIFIIVLACSVSALGYVPDNFTFSNVLFCEYYSNTLYDFGLSFLDVVYLDEDVYYQVAYFTADYDKISNILHNDSFLHSSLSAIDYMGINPMTSSTVLSSIYSSDTYYSNLDYILTGINTFGDNYRNYFNSQTLNEDLQLELDQLNTEIEHLENNIIPFERAEGYSQGYHNGNKVGYNKGYTQGFNEGETAGIETADVAKTSILTVLSAPFYALSSIFNFEIFGINILTIVTSLITLAVIAFVLKKIKG